jgi:hypothetical protein
MGAINLHGTHLSAPSSTSRGKGFFFEFAVVFVALVLKFCRAAGELFDER